MFHQARTLYIILFTNKSFSCSVCQECNHHTITYFIISMGYYSCYTVVLLALAAHSNNFILHPQTTACPFVCVAVSPQNNISHQLKLIKHPESIPINHFCKPPTAHSNYLNRMCPPSMDAIRSLANKSKYAHQLWYGGSLNGIYVHQEYIL